MKKKIERLHANLSFNIIGAIVLVFVLFGVLVSFLGFASFTEAFKREYETTTYHMADTATTLVNGDHLKAYLAGEETEEYQRSKRNLDLYCKKINVSLVYVIDVDTSDYGSFVSVFNSVKLLYGVGARAQAEHDQRRVSAEIPGHLRAGLGVRDGLPPQTGRRRTPAYHDHGAGEGLRGRSESHPLHTAPRP